MEKLSKYILEFNGKDYRFLKDGLMHREAGPALFLKEEKDKYLNLDDENLYKKVNTENEKDELQNFIKNLVSLTGRKAFYYLYDIQYNKDEFDSIILNHQLQKELSNINTDSKKLKA